MASLHLFSLFLACGMCIFPFVSGQGSVIDEEPFMDSEGFRYSSGLPQLPPLAEYVLSYQNEFVDVRSVVPSYSPPEQVFWEAFHVESMSYASRDRLSTATRGSPLPLDKILTPPLSNTGQAQNGGEWIRNTVNGAQEVYKRAFDASHVNLFFSNGYNWYRSFSRGTYDIVANVRNKGDVDWPAVMMNVSFGLNEAYNQYRASMQKQGYTVILDGKGVITSSKPGSPTVTQLLRQLKGAQLTMSWLENNLMRCIYEMHEMNHYQVDGPPRDAYGYPRNGQGYNKGIMTAVDMYFFAGRYMMMIGHYGSHLSDAALIRAREYVLAFWTALYNTFQFYSWDYHTATNQWLLRIEGLNMGYYFALKSEAEMKARGIWRSSDNVAKSDPVAGKWTNEDMKAAVYRHLNGFVEYMEKYAIREYASTYYGYSMDVLAWAMLHCADEYIYSRWERIYALFWLDVAMNYFPASGTMSGPSGRDYDLFDRAHGNLDRYEIIQHILSYLYEIEHTSPKGTLPFKVQPQSATLSFQWGKFLLAQQQVAGLHYLPVDVLSSITVGMPWHINEQRFAPSRGQERYNLVTPRYTIGHAGDDKIFFNLNIQTVARLGGSPNPAYPAYYSSETTNSVNMVRLFPSFTDNLAAGAGPKCCYAGAEQQVPHRQIAAQHQSWMLITNLISAGIDDYKQPIYGEQAKYVPVNSNLVLPLAVEELYVDDIPLPRKSGASMAIKPDSIITVRHNGASIVARLLFYEYDSTAIQEPTATFTYTGAAGNGVYPYSIMWRIDPAEWPLGFGRIIVHHQNKAKPPSSVSTDKLNPPPSYHIAWLLGAGNTDTDQEMKSLQLVAREAKYTQTLTTDNSFKLRTSQPNDKKSRGKSVWSARVDVADTVLSVSRTDHFWPTGMPNADSWFETINTPPFYTEPTFTRTVNGKPILDFSDGDFPYRVTGLNPNAAQFWQPHLVLSSQIKNSLAFDKLPDLLPLSGSFSVDLAYSCYADNYIRLVVYSDNPYTYYTYADTYVNKKTGVATIQIQLRSIVLPADYNIKLNAYLLDATVIKNEKKPENFKLANTVATVRSSPAGEPDVKPLRPSVLPNTLQTAFVPVSYSCPYQQCVVVADFLEPVGTWPNTGQAHALVPQGPGTVPLNVTLTTPPSPHSNYLWNAWMVKTDVFDELQFGAWTKALAVNKLDVKVEPLFMQYCAIRMVTFPATIQSAGTLKASMMITCTTNNPAGLGNVSVIGEVWRAVDNTYWGRSQTEFQIVSGRTRIVVDLEVPYQIQGSSNGVIFCYWPVDSLYYGSNPRTAWQYMPTLALKSINVVDAFEPPPPTPLPPVLHVPDPLLPMQPSPQTIGFSVVRTRISLGLSSRFPLDLMSSQDFLTQLRQELAMVLSVPTAQIQIAQIYAGRTLVTTQQIVQFNQTVPVTREEVEENWEILWQVKSLLVDVDLYPLINQTDMDNYSFEDDPFTNRRMLRLSDAVIKHLFDTFSQFAQVCLPFSKPKYSLPAPLAGEFRWGAALDQLDCYYLSEEENRLHQATVHALLCADGSLRADCAQSDVSRFTPPQSSQVVPEAPVPRPEPPPPSIIIPVMSTDLRLVFPKNSPFVQELQNYDWNTNRSIEVQLASLTNIPLKYIEFSSATKINTTDPNQEGMLVRFHIYPELAVMEIANLASMEVVLDTAHLVNYYNAIHDRQKCIALQNTRLPPTVDNVIAQSRDCYYIGPFDRIQSQLCQSAESLKNIATVDVKQLVYRHSYCTDLLPMLLDAQTDANSGFLATTTGIGVVVGIIGGAVSVFVFCVYLYIRRRRASAKFQATRRQSLQDIAVSAPPVADASSPTRPPRPQPPALPGRGVRMRRLSNDPMAANLHRNYLIGTSQ